MAASRHKSLASLYKAYVDCRRCPLADGRRHVVFGAGPADAMLMIVGEAPGKNEDGQGVPFIGPSGKLLRAMLKRAKIRTDDVFFTNAVCCRPVNADGRDQAPTPSEVRACSARLMETIYLADPQLIVAVGATAVNALVGGKTAITTSRGQMVTMTTAGVNVDIVYPVFQILHPSFLLRNPDLGKGGWMSTTVDDLKKVGGIINRLKECQRR